jgi:hypothetical protein
MDNEKWLSFYGSDRSNTSRVFIKVMMRSGKHIFFSCKDYARWYEIKSMVENDNDFVAELELQFRSNKIEIPVQNVDALYLVRSGMGSPGMATKLYITVGKLYEGKLTKYMYLYPELIMENEFEDSVENCFEEALIYDPKATKDGQE